MVDLFSLGVTHFLMAIAFWKLALSPGLDRDPDAPAAGSEEDEARA